MSLCFHAMPVSRNGLMQTSCALVSGGALKGASACPVNAEALQTPSLLPTLKEPLQPFGSAVNCQEARCQGSARARERGGVQDLGLLQGTQRPGCRGQVYKAARAGVSEVACRV